jgi:parvulin-like peptidyl-prolyl isomerase
MSNQGSTPKIVTKKHIARLERERQQVTLIKWIAVGSIILVALLLGYGYFKTTFLVLREPVAEVNGETITTEEFQERVKLERIRQLNMIETYTYYQQYFGMDTSQQISQIQLTLQTPSILGQQVLDKMVEELIVRQEAAKMGISVSEEEVNKSIQNVYGFFPNGTPSPTLTSTPFEYPTMSAQLLTLYPSTSTPTTAPTSTVASTNTPDPAATATATATVAPATPTLVPEQATATSTPYTLDGFNSQYEKTLGELKVYGISEKTLRGIYEFELLYKKMLDKVASDVPHTEEQVWARHILFDDAVKAKAGQVLLLGGADFAEMAKKESKDTGSGANGGDLGWFGRGAMVAPFEEAAFSQEIGAIGEVVQSDFGYHIIQVLDKAELPLTDSQYQQKRETAFNDWLTTTKETAAITTYDGWQAHVPTEPQVLNTPAPAQ